MRADIYLVLDVHYFCTPSTLPTLACLPYSAEYLQSVFSTIDGFHKYDKKLAFISGNEAIIKEVEMTNAVPNDNVTTRDMKSYITSRTYHQTSVGYPAADGSAKRMQLAL